MTDFWDEMTVWARPYREMGEVGFDLNKVPDEMFEEHIWADGILLFWHRHKRLPLAWELADEMFDEWDDPVSLIEADRFLIALCS